MRQSAEKELPSDLLLAFGVCDVDAFPNIHHLLLIACTLPISSAEAEWYFSLMKRIKTCTRSRMPEERFSDLAVIDWHYPKRFEVELILEDSFRLCCLINAEICRETTNNYIVDTAILFNYALLFWGFWLRKNINSGGAFHLVKNSENSGSGLNGKRFFGSPDRKIPRKSGTTATTF